MNIKLGFLAILLAMGTTLTSCNTPSEQASETNPTQEATAEAATSWEPKKSSPRSPR